jgi:hypothetical protein
VRKVEAKNRGVHRSHVAGTGACRLQERAQHLLLSLPSARACQTRKFR